MVHFILVRHGQTEWNRVERFRGRSDVPLNATGFQQAGATGRRIALDYGSEVAAVYTSPLPRTRQTAEIISRYVKRPAQNLDALIDIDMGQWQGLTPAEVGEEWPDLLPAWYHAPHTSRFPGGETLDEVRDCVMPALTQLGERHDGETIVLVSHTEVNRVMLLGILGLGNDRLWHLRQDNCAINTFERTGEDYTLVTANDTAHLRPWANLQGPNKTG
jgi:broad specificity phosphatase PhoE